MANTFLGGMGFAYEGAQQGVQDNIDRSNQEENRKFLRDQQEFQRGQRKFTEGQQARQVEEQGRADKLRTDLGLIPQTKPVDVNVVKGDDEGNVMPAANVDKPRAQDEVLRDVAKAYKDAGDVGKYFELNTAADGFAFRRSAKEFGQVLAASGGMQLPDLARRVGAIFDADPTGGGVESVQDIPGGVSVTLVNRETGRKETVQFVGEAGKKQLLDMAQAHYNPQAIADQLKHARQVQIEALKKGVTSVPDGYVDLKPDGSREFVRTQAGGTGTKGDGKPPKTRDEQGAEQLEFAITKGEVKFSTPQQATTARRTMAQLLKENPTMPTEVGVDLAVRVALEPDAVKPGLNIETGSFDDLVKDEKTGGMFAVKKNVGSPDKLPAGITPDDAKAQLKEAFSTMEAATPGITAAYAAAAFGDKGRPALDAFMTGLARQAFERDPRFAQIPPEKQAELISEALAKKAGAIDNYLELTRKFGTPPKVEKTPSKKPERQGFGIGIPPSASVRYGLQ